MHRPQHGATIVTTQPCALRGLPFSTNVSAIAAVLGVDLGTEYIKATLVKPGIPLEIVLTKDSRRKETSAVAFKPFQNAPKSGAYPERAYGSDAMALSARFPSDVYPNLKTLLGLPADDAQVSEYLARHPALQMEKYKDRDTVSFKSKVFTAEEDSWMVEELLAMELQSIQRNAESLAGSDTLVRSAVITVPPFYTVEEKRAVQMAAELIGLKVLSLISDGMAVGLNYATSRQFPNINEGAKPEYHMVFDMGAGSAKATVMKFQSRTVKDVGKFNKTVQEVQVVGNGWDRTLGGDALNYLILDDMVQQFVESPAAKKASVTIDSVQKHGRAVAKLLKEAEKLRHILSANTESRGSFEGLYEDIDFKYKITRADFEKMAEAHAERVGAAVQKALDAAELDISQLDSIILHGGASRTPFVQKALEKVAGNEKLRSNVNSDESAVFGAGFRAADLSPSFRVKEIKALDAAGYAAGMKWTSPQGKAQQQRLWTERSILGATLKEVTFTNHEDLTVKFYQSIPSADGAVEKETKTFTTKNLTATVAQLVEKNGCKNEDIQFKVKLQLRSEDGEVDVVKAHVECEAEDTDKEGSVMDGVKNLFGFGKKDQQPLKDGEESSEDAETASTTASTDTATTSSVESSTTTSTETGSASAESTDAAKPKKTIVVPVDFKLEKAGVPELSKDDLGSAKSRIKAFEMSDRSRRAREETLNQLEAFTYRVRDLLDSESFVATSSKNERAALEKKAGEVSEWLYDDGADATRDELKSRLKSLKDMVSPVEKRIKEKSERPELVKSLRGTLNQTATFIETIRKQIAEAEAWSSSASANAASATSGEASSVTAAPSKSSDDFDGLEDDAAASTTTTATSEDVGPVPVLYTMDDLKEITDLSKSTLDWLEKKLAEQAKLPETADPVITVDEISKKAKKLEQVGMQLAMKAVKNFDSKGGKKSSKKSGKKSDSTKTGTAAGSEQTIDADEIEKMVKKMAAEQAQKDKEQEKNKDKPKHDEL
ncbi:heat shock protein 70-like protein [Apiospora aurea]|uniref:Heat shock protein 70-like protein n=1 Tax=Apiospora aurea TaxID=335848 RepID=A0ABR1Q977_9PEZI